MTFRHYVCDALMMLTENTALSERKYITARLYDLMHGSPVKQEETAEQIVARIRRAIEE